MANRPIKITGSDPSTGTLTLSDHGNSVVNPGDTILWQIKNGSGVEKIIAIKQKTGSTDIFSSPPFPEGNTWRGNVSPRIWLGAAYIYSIVWETNDGHQHTFDPIISIRPTMHDTFTIERAATFAIGFAAGAALTYLILRDHDFELRKSIENPY